MSFIDRVYARFSRPCFDGNKDIHIKINKRFFLLSLNYETAHIPQRCHSRACLPVGRDDSFVIQNYEGSFFMRTMKNDDVFGVF